MIRTKSVAYGVLAVYEIAKQHKGVSSPTGVQAADIAKKYKLPTAYCAKIMSILARKGVLRSDRGPNGGFFLSRPIDKISIWDILDSVDAFGGDGKLFNGYPPAVQNLLNKAIADGMLKMRDVCKKVSLEEMV